jgi:ATP-dependent Clp protease ATP-binding subunit ClpX
VTSEDFIKFGLIPEFMGRLPVTVPFESLSEDALYEILWKPKNSLVKQYKKLFELEKVSLRFTPEAMRAIVREAVTRKSGARGLRAITEEIMLDIMYELPDMTDVRECVIHEGVVLHHEAPQLVPAKKSA